MMRAFRFTAVAALAVLAAGGVSQLRQVAPQVSPQAKCFGSDGVGGYVLHDGTRVQVDPADVSVASIAAFGRRGRYSLYKFLLHGSEIVAIMRTRHLESACPQPSIPPPYSPAPARLLA